jgi:hypothetical protein
VIVTRSVAALAASVIAAVVYEGHGAHRREAPPVNEKRVAALVSRELRAIDAADAAALVEGGSARPLVVVGSFSLPHSDGHALIVGLGLAPGLPGNLSVATGIDYLRYSLDVGDDGKLTVVERPARADLVAGVRQVLAKEADACEAATAAMVRAKFALPAGKASWREALRSVTYDARLPRKSLAGDPSWSFIFEPWDEQHGGWHQVLLGAGLSVELVDGRAPS